MLRCPGRIAGYTTQAACDALGRSQTEKRCGQQVGLTCDSDPSGCIVGSELLVHGDRSLRRDRPEVPRKLQKSSTVTVRIVDRTPGNGGFGSRTRSYFNLGLYADFNIGVSGPRISAMMLALTALSQSPAACVRSVDEGRLHHGIHFRRQIIFCAAQHVVDRITGSKLDIGIGFTDGQIDMSINLRRLSGMSSPLSTNSLSSDGR